jgi:hypothetical protein
VDKNGNVIIGAFANKEAVLRSGGLWFESGNTLIERIINSSFILKIELAGANNFYPNIWSDAYDENHGSGGTIHFNPLSDPNVLTVQQSTGVVVEDKRPAYIGLAHELIIHADRAMRGVMIDMNKYANYSYIVSKEIKYFIFKSWSWESVKTATEHVPREELATVGLKYNNPSDITENDIRAEHNLSLRGAYSSK